MIIQVLTITVVVLLLWLVISSARARLEIMGVNTGFDFLSNRAGYDLGESLIPYDGDDSYGWALVAGLSNTLKVALTSIFAALTLGVATAAALLSNHPVANRIARFYIRIVRNTPLLLQLFFWFALFTISFPGIRDSYQPFPGVHLSNRGLNFPLPDQNLWLFVLVGIAVLIATKVAVASARRKGISGTRRLIVGLILGLGIVPIAVFLGLGTMQMPQVTRFAIRGGGVLTPEFMTLFVGLSIYTATYIAESLRGAVQAVSKGQSEAAGALGLSRAKTFKLVVLPQATRVAIPSTVSELLNLVKNSSLGVAVGYPDLVSVGNTAMNQTGQAIEMIAIYMIVYVSINVIITKFSQALEARYEW